VKVTVEAHAPLDVKLDPVSHNVQEEDPARHSLSDGRWSKVQLFPSTHAPLIILMRQSLASLPARWRGAHASAHA
jgi:hypothetical protein